MNTKKNPNINKGAVILSLIFILLFFVVTGRYFYLGWTGEAEGVDLHDVAEEKWTREKPLDAKRGTFYDRHGEVIAEDIPAYTVIAILDKNHTDRVKDPEKAAAKLAPLLDMSESRLVDLMSKKEAYQVELGPGGDKISHSKMKKIKALDISGIDFIRKTKRYYPNQTFASHITGFTTYNENGKREGAMGLERTLDEYLREEDGKLIYQSDRKGYKLPDPNEVMVEPKNGHNVHLTIDENIQLYLEQAMSKVDEEYDPKRMIGIVADPKTGKILAMSNRPSFNPNERDIDNYTNYAIGARFEPGSTMKVFTLAAAIEEGVYNGDATYKSGSYTTSYGEKINDHNGGKGWGTITYDEGVRKSSNVAFMRIAKEQLGFGKLYEYLTKKFEFDQKTGIDLPGEADSRIQFEYETEKLTTAFGQGTAITPIQQIQAATAIANGGKMMKPYVIEKIVNPENDKVIQNHEPDVVGNPISKETSQKVRDLLRTVVTDGTGKPYNIEGYEVSGKTGTAQIPDPKGGYLTGWDNYIFSFLGMAPKDDPKLLVYVAVDRPDLDLESYESGSEPVSQVFNFVMKNSLQYLNIVPEESNSNEKEKSEQSGIPLADYEGQSSEEVQKGLKEKGLDVLVLGEGDNVVAQAPFPDTTVLKGEKVIVRTDGKVKMHDLAGWSRSEVMQVARILKLKTPEFVGNGYAVLQSIAPNAVVKEGSSLVVELKSPQEIAEAQQDDKEKDKKEKGKEEKEEEQVTD
ncbi:penicillin-binding protein [Pseudalkalibacillus decolorationis]|uniref:penicillin-binding protein n=1 Tax=Pseudalkalibacillus decolorationis TaxID=163879 RepID=UPI0021472BDE|nr:PASTA domain-containing penicillin-binding protein [Pseudalkalibacillus decolorationis]